MNSFYYGLSLGSNLGDSVEYLRKACLDLKRVSLFDFHCSGLYETPPHGPQNQKKYLNQAVLMHSYLEPLELLHYCKGLELLSGRNKKEHWGARELDIDLLFCREKCGEWGRLKLPHPLMHVRQFVLYPLSEILKEVVPGFTENPLEMLHLAVDSQGLESISRRLFETS